MTSLIIVDKNDKESEGNVSGSEEEADEKDPLHVGSSTPSPSGDSVVAPRSQSNMVETISPPGQCVPIMVDDVPVYLTQLEDGSPVYLRQYPPTVEELLSSPLDQCSSFDGFSEASGSTFEGFSETSGSTFEGFSEVSRSSSITFEGFLQDNLEDLQAANVLRDRVLRSARCEKEDLDELIKKEEIVFEDVGDDPPLEDDTKNNVSVMFPSELSKEATENFKTKNVDSIQGQVETNKSKKLVLDCHESTPVCNNQPTTSGIIPKKLFSSSKSKKSPHQNYETNKSEHVRDQLQTVEKKAETSTRQTRRSVDQNESEGSDAQGGSLKTRRLSSRLPVEERNELSSEGIIIVSDYDHIGEFCTSVGCTISFLESMKIKNVTVNNGIVYELDEFAKKIAWERVDVAKWIQRLSGVKCREPTVEDLEKIHMVLKRRKALRVTLAGQKIGNMKLRAFDSTQFILPSSVKEEFPEHEGLLFVTVKEEEVNAQGNLSGSQTSPEHKGSTLSKKRKLSFKKYQAETFTHDESSWCSKEDKEMGLKKSKKEPVRNRCATEKETSSIWKTPESEKCSVNEKEEGKDEREMKNEKEEEYKKDDGRRKRINYRKNSKIGKHCLDRGDAELSLVSNNDSVLIQKAAAEVNEKQTQETVCINLSSEVKEEIEIKTEKVPLTSEVQNVDAGTFGVSKSGRLRKLSAKGFSSFELKSLFMPTQPPLSTQSSQSTNVTEKPKSCSHFTSKNEYRKERTHEFVPHQFKGSLLNFSNKYRNLLDVDNSVISFTFKDGHLVPKFKEIDYYLGDYCCEAGVTVEDLNSNGPKDVDMTYGMIKELQEFYLSRGATKTALAVRLFQMCQQKIVDYTHILTAVITVTKAAKTSSLDFPRLQKEFKFPKRQFPGQPRKQKEPKPPQKKKMLISTKSLMNLSSKKKKKDLSLKLKKMKNAKTANVRGRKKKIEMTVNTTTEDVGLDTEVVRTRGKEGSITRGDIVCLYTHWLKSKMAVGSNVFVTDLLKDVEKLMMERKVQLIRIPAGTLMSSSVKLHDEYKQMLKVSKEDALMYLEEDWLEDIQYLVSLSGPSRRSTVDGDNGDNTTEKMDVSSSAQNEKSGVSDSEFSEKSLAIDDSVISDDSSTSTNKKTPGSQKTDDQSAAASIGKRSLKRKGISNSVEGCDLESFKGDDIKKCPRKQKDSLFTETHEDLIRKTIEKKNNNNPLYKEEDYEVQKILDHQIMYDESGGTHYGYIVRWLGFGPEDDSWVNEADLHCPKLLDSYWKTAKRRKGGGRLSWKKSLSKKPEEGEVLDVAIVGVDGPDKENGNIIETMIRRTSQDNSSGPKDPQKGENVVTVRELLDLYDTWRQENQNVLMAGGSNTVNLEMLVTRARALMTSRCIKYFHPESLLNACFMMTLMRTTLKTERTLCRFLDSDCSEVLEASYKQHLKTQQRHRNGGVPERKNRANGNINISILQNELKRLQQDFSEAVGLRLANRNILRMMEEELHCLENILKSSKDGSVSTSCLLQQELQILKEDLNSLENKNGRRSNSLVSNTKRIGRGKSVEDSKPLIAFTETNSNKFKEIVLQTGQELIECGVPSQKVDSVIELVVNKIGGQRLRAWPVEAQSISEVIGLKHK
ncbi:uncharacterized protein LOC121853652 [Homarus americanus]|uniref:Putative Chromo (CHRromatin Organization MOdifier) domain-containing protein n=1 Tax=Homarus americanus TaxID=6706 RepID=A0A8J5MM79_HOMAM|nr:uncharacterized protein LOC121853652 [Homarus americanus]KAG7156574.1 putative Chromo (CHRromatin Organization MOdifier) domain-containing protein [Homarus americanus]